MWHKFCWRQLTFTPTEFPSRILQWAECRDMWHYRPLCTCATIYLLKVMFWLLNFISNCHLKGPPWQLPIDIQIPDWKRDSSYFQKKNQKCSWYYSFSHSCVSRLSGRHCCGCQCWLFDSSFPIYPSKPWKNISSNELCLPSPAHRPQLSQQAASRTRVPAYCMVGCCVDDNAITRISVFTEGRLATVVSQLSLRLCVSS